MKFLGSWLTEQPLIPVSVVSVIIGMILWLTSIYTTAENAAADVGELKDILRVDMARRDQHLYDLMQSNYLELQKVNSRLSKIESKLDN